MSEVKHTPGPWNFLEAHGRIENQDYIVARISGFEVKGVYPPLEQAMADGRLIAAAPELLEALGDLLAWWNSDRPLPSSNISELWTKAEAAIRKAKGE